MIEEVTTTTVLIPSWACRVDEYGNLILERE
jgi:N-methylhydantoinase A/oxoprolinase/acetone carboxylase beta subunit